VSHAFISLPLILFLHLMHFQRISRDTGKVLSRCEFPADLDMGQSRTYRLSDVFVHSGQAVEQGHYFLYALTRAG
jgi:hypothetical protein